MSFTIDPGLKALIPPLSTEERDLLEASILEHGCRDPLVVWRGTLLDGHNRFEICERHGIEFSTVEIDLPDRQAAEDWMDANQLGRRNLTPDAFKWILGRRYNRTKKTHGGDRKSKGQIDPLKESTAAKLAKEHAVSEATVKRAAKFAEEVEKVPEIKQAVEQGKPVLQVTRELKERAREQRRSRTAGACHSGAGQKMGSGCTEMKNKSLPSIARLGSDCPGSAISDRDMVRRYTPSAIVSSSEPLNASMTFLAGSLRCG